MGLMTVSERLLVERLLWVVAGLEVMVSFLTALIKMSRATSLPLRALHDPLHLKSLTSSEESVGSVRFFC